MNKSIVVIITMLAMMQGIRSHAQTAYDRTSIRCLGVELDGSQTLRVLGYGRNRSDAKEQAMKNAVWAVIFDGIQDGVQGCETKPLVTEANAREKYEDYFNLFFADNGPYKDYVSLRDTKKRSGGRKKNKLGYAYDLTIRVLRAELKTRLKEDNVINKK